MYTKRKNLSGLVWAALVVGWLVWPASSSHSDRPAVRPDPPPREPPLKYKVGWKATPAGVVVIEYFLDGLTVYFVHSIQQSKPTDHWRPARRENGMLYLTTIEADPTIYEVSAEAIKYRYAYQPEFIDLIHKTYCPASCK